MINKQNKIKILKNKNFCLLENFHMLVIIETYYEHIVDCQGAHVLTHILTSLVSSF